MLDKSLLSKVQSVYIKSRRLATQAFTGEFESAFRGQGMEFEEFREYVPGDDIRAIDWNVTARMDKPYIKIYREEREQSVMLLVDVSKSLDYGSQKKSKKEYITEFAALIAYAASQTQDKVGLILFSDVIEKFIPPKKGKSHVWQVIRTILTFKPTGVKTDVNVALKYLNEVLSRPAVTFVISDFLTAPFYERLRVAHVKHDMIPIVIRDPVENEFKKGYRFMFRDVESGYIREIDLSQKKNRDLFAGKNLTQANHLKKSFDQLGLDSLFLLVGQDYLNPLIKLFRLREHR